MLLPENQVVNYSIDKLVSYKTSKHCFHCSELKFWNFIHTVVHRRFSSQPIWVQIIAAWLTSYILWNKSFKLPNITPAKVATHRAAMRPGGGSSAAHWHWRWPQPRSVHSLNWSSGVAARITEVGSKYQLPDRHVTGQESRFSPGQKRKQLTRCNKHLTLYSPQIT